MTNPLLIVRRFTFTPRNPDGGFRDGEEVLGGERVMWHCPGCNGTHYFRVRCEGSQDMEGPYWEWDGNMEQPTFSPSYKTWQGSVENPTYICHSFVKAGQIEYLADCTHELASKTVPMEPHPDRVMNWYHAERIQE